jgi:hypothetical protein
MSKKRSDTSRGEEPSGIDDLQLINGIGPAVERRLHGVGIFTYAQLAALPPADIAAAVADLAGLSAERIIKQDWIGQAYKLASESISSEAQEKIEVPAEPVVSEVELAASAVEVTEPASPVVAAPKAKEADIPPPVVAMTGIPRLHQIETVSAGAHTPQNVFVHDQPFNVHLILDLSSVSVPGDTQFSYTAFLYSKNLEGRPRQVVGETSGIVTSTDKVTVSVEGIALPKGTYRLKAMLILNPMTTEPVQQPSLVASKEGDLLLIF